MQSPPDDGPCAGRANLARSITTFRVGPLTCNRWVWSMVFTRCEPSKVRSLTDTSFVLVTSSSRQSVGLGKLWPRTDAQRRMGLMRVTDLKGYVGMVFRFPTDSQSGFHMRNTPMPLSIAWFAAAPSTPPRSAP